MTQFFNVREEKCNRCFELLRIRILFRSIRNHIYMMSSSSLHVQLYQGKVILTKNNLSHNLRFIYLYVTVISFVKKKLVEG